MSGLLARLIIAIDGFIIVGHAMAPPPLPPVIPSAWLPWESISRPSRDFDVPRHFGVAVLCHAEKQPAATACGYDLPATVVYVGSSQHVDRRLEDWHAAVARYKGEFSDPAAERLWIATCATGGASGLSQPLKTIDMQRLLLVERAMLFAYCATHGALSAINRA